MNFENHICTCKEKNAKLGKDIYFCFKCELKKPDNKQKRKGMYLGRILSKASIFLSPTKLNKLRKDLEKKFDHENKKV